MKKILFLLSIVTALILTSLVAKEIRPNFAENKDENNKEQEYSKLEQVLLRDQKILQLNKLLEYQQRTYDEKLAYFENELKKANDRLIDSTTQQQKNEEYLKQKCRADITNLKKELVSKTKTLYEHQRLLEKLKPSKDLKDLVVLNTELASQLRQSEDKVAIINLNFKRASEMAMINNKSLKRFPASVKSNKK